VRFPAAKTALAATCNRLDASPSSLIARAAEVVLAGKLSARPPDAPTAPKGPFPVAQAEVDRIAGLYFDPSTFEVRRIEPSDGGLLYRRGDNATPLQPRGSKGYRVAVGEVPLEIRFEPGGDGPAKAMRFRQERSMRVFRRAAPWEPDVAELCAFCGEYESDEIDAKYRIELSGDHLVLHRRGEDPTPLKPLFRDAFENEDVGAILFSRTAPGTVTQFEISNGASRIPFRRRAS
jgi:hypothetical protein